MVTLLEGLSLPIFCQQALIVNPQEEAEEIFNAMLLQPNPNYFVITHTLDSILSQDTTSIEESDFSPEYFRWKEFWRLRADGNGSFDAYARSSNGQLNLVPSTCNSLENIKWKNIGVDAFPDQAASLVFAMWAEKVSNHPEQLPQKILIGTMGGVWKSTNGGTSWVFLPLVDNATGDTYAGAGISSIAVDPNNSDNIWIGTRNHFQYDFFSSGVYFSNDGGSTWTRDDDINSKLDAKIGTYPGAILEHVRVAVSPVKGTVYAIAGEKLFRRETNGIWSLIFTHPSNPSILFRDIAFVPDLTPTENDAIFIASYFGNCELWRIIDDLSSAPIATQISVTSPYPSIPYSNFRISIPSKDKLYLMGCRDFNPMPPQTNKDFYRDISSTYLNLGNSLTNFNSASVGDNQLGLQQFTVSKSLSASGLEVMYYGNLRLHKTTNAGTNWSQVGDYNGHVASSEVTHGDIRGMLQFYSSSSYLDGINDIILAGSDGGICIKKPDPNPFVKFANGNGHNLTIGSFGSVACTERDYRIVASGMSHNGLFLFKNATTPDYIWNRLIYQQDNGAGRFDDWDNPQDQTFSNNLIYQQSSGGAIDMYYKPNFGQYGGSCSAYCGISLNIPSNLSPVTAYAAATYNYRPVKVHPITKEFYVGYNEILKVKHNNTSPYLSFDNVAVTTCGQDFSITGEHIVSIDINTSDPNGDILYVAYTTNDCNAPQKKLFKKNANGTYTDISNKPGFPWCWPVASVVSNPSNANEVWVSFGSYYIDWQNNNALVPNKERVFYSCDGGNNWVDRSEGLPDIPVTCLVYQKGTNDLIYAGTEAGVYIWKPNYINHNCSASPSAGHWECFNSGLPIAPVIDLEINYCGRKLRASISDQGFWEADLPASTLPAEDEIHLSTAYSIGTNYIDHDIHIFAPAVVTLNPGTTLKFAKDRKIIIEPGAKLIANGATLTDACNCTWNGIIVKGNKPSVQDLSSNNNFTAISNNQGFLFLNNSTIENTYEAIRVYNPDDGWVSATNTNNIGGTGGIVRAVNTTFRNVRRAAEFMWYRSYQGIIGGGVMEVPNKSYFHLCHFTEDNNHKPDHPFSAYVTMWGTYGIQFRGCDFTNNNSTVANPNQLGTGIGSADANYMIFSYGTTTSKFKNLYNGVLAQNASATPYAITCTGAKFTDNVCGLTLTNSNYSRIQSNTFTIGHLPLTTPFFYGMYGTGINNSTQFVYTGNYFNTDNGLQNIFVAGSWFNNTSASTLSENLVNNNRYKSIPWANLANYINRSAATGPLWISGLQGLQYKCNMNYTNGFDFTVYQQQTNSNHGVRFLQGINAITDPHKSAGNIFSAATAGPNEHQFRNTSQFPINYYCQGNVDCPDPTNCTPSGLFNTITDGTAANCSGIGGGGFPTGLTADVEWEYIKLTPTQIQQKEVAFTTAKQSYNYYKGLYQSLLDGGNTEQLKNEVESSWPSETYALRAKLLGESPYLSEDVLKEAAGKVEVLTNSIIFEILAANPDGVKNEKLIQYLEEKDQPLPQWMISFLRNNRGTITYRTMLEYSLSFFGEKYMEKAREIIMDMLSDTSGFDHTALRGWLGNIEDREADYMIIDDFIETENYSSAQTLLDAIPNMYSLKGFPLDEYNSVKDFVEFRIALAQNGKSFSNLGEEEISQLERIATDGTGIGQQKAKNVLNFFTGANYETHPEFPQENANKKESTVAPNQTNAISYVTVFPNPAKDLAIFEYQLPCVDQKGQLLIADVNGKQILTEEVTGSKSQKVIDTKSFANGTYFYRINCDGKTIGSGNLVITK